jgi:hypothetical protein
MQERRKIGGTTERWFDQLRQDLRFGARTLRANPGFALTAVLTLALATGATTAIFSIVDGVLFEPLPFVEPDRLVHVYGRAWREDRPGVVEPIDGPVAPVELEAYAKQNRTFDAFAGYAITTRHMETAAGSERLTAVQADLDLFETLGTRALAGRTFLQGDPQDVVVISERLWRTRFDADPSLPGGTITLDGRVHTILGVMPDRFQFPYSAASMMEGALTESRTDLWLPMAPLRAGERGELRRGRSSVIARVKPGVSYDAAAADLRLIARRVEEEVNAGTPYRVGVRVAPFADEVTAPVRASLWMLFAAVGLVLLATCANVANLLLARMSAREDRA